MLLIICYKIESFTNLHVILAQRIISVLLQFWYMCCQSAILACFKHTIQGH